MIRVTVQRPVWRTIRLRVRFHFTTTKTTPVEEVSPVKPKKPSRRAAKAKKDEPKEVNETPKEWTVEEKIALCQGTLKMKLVQQEVMTRSLANGKIGFALKLVLFAPSSKILNISGGLNLNEEAGEAVEETQEFRPMGRDRAKTKKKAAGSSRGGASSFVDLVWICQILQEISQKRTRERMSDHEIKKSMPKPEDHAQPSTVNCS
ncbi:hypothetical protein Tco_1296055 [Tanacetum coccineum]